MTTTAPPAPPRTGVRLRGTRRLPKRQETVTLLLSTWLIVGLFVDGWAHVNLSDLETFFTPWHALFYSGFTACAAWIAWLVVRGQEQGRSLRDAIPAGYELAVLGLVVFAVGGAADFTWHTVFGVEADLDALFSPSHLALFMGIALIVSSPFRAAWGDPEETRPRLLTFLPPLLSLALLTSLVAFFLMEFSSFIDLSPTYSDNEQIWMGGIASALLTNLIIVVPALHLLRRWRLPFGSLTVLFTFVATIVNGLFAFEYAVLILPAFVGGLGADLLAARLRPAPDQPRSWRLFGFLLPLPLWAAYYLVLQLGWGLAWPIEITTGVPIYNALITLLLAHLLLPVRIDRMANADRQLDPTTAG
jgi:hypothetical protein